jgi:hypothetical protein
MTKITGRPPKAIRQEKNIGFFATTEQYAVIQEKAAQAKVNISDYMRQMAVNGYVRIRWTEEDVRLLKQLVELSNDLYAVMEIAGREEKLFGQGNQLKDEHKIRKTPRQGHRHRPG